MNSDIVWGYILTLLFLFSVMMETVKSLVKAVVGIDVIFGYLNAFVASSKKFLLLT